MTISVTPSSLGFGRHFLNNGSSLQILIEHTTADAPFTAALEGSNQFTVSPASGTIGADGTRVTVVFKATSNGRKSATLVLTSGTETLRVPLSGEGADAATPEARGAHLLIEVPDYGDTTYVNTGTAEADQLDTSSLDGNNLRSYLRLGAFDFDRESDAAKQLLGIIPLAGPAKDPRSADPETEILPDVKGFVFVDDVRVRPQDTRTSLTTGDDPDHGLTMTERQEESMKLYARGGWRDHSDGNRISTTWGDKVEVVRGNYKMIVLGRQNNPAQAMGWEATGGHIQDYAPGTMPGASFWLEWIDDTRYYATGDGGDGRKGAWLLVNTTENVYQFQRTAGTLRSENWGDVHESYVGSENPPDASKVDAPTAAASFAVDDTHGTKGHSVDDAIKIPGRKYLVTTPPDDKDQKGKIRSNPHIIEKTWAARIDAYTGTPNCPVPTIVEGTFANDITSKTGDSDHRVHTITESTWAKKTEELVDVEERIVSNTRAGNIVEATTAGTITGATTAANIAEMTTAGVHTEIHLGGAHVGIELGVFHFELEVGLKGSVQVAAGFELNVGPIKELHTAKQKLALSHQETALSNVRQALTNAATSLEDKKASLEAQHLSLAASLKALSLQLGV